MVKEVLSAKPSRLTSYIFMLINTVTWGASMVIVKPSLEVTTPFRFLLYRYVIAAAIGFPIILYYWSRTKPSLRLVWRVFLIEMLGTGLALWLVYEGLARTGAIEAGMLTSAQPIFVAVVGVWLFKEILQRNELFGLLMAFAGTVVLTLVPLFTNGSTWESMALSGNVLILLYLVANAFYYPLTKKYYQGAPKLLVSSLSFYVGLVFFAVLSFAEASFSFSELSGLISSDLMAPSVIMASVYMAIFGSLIGYTALIKGLEGIEASEAILFNYLQPLVYIPMGIILLHETIHPIQIISLIVIIAGVVVAEKRQKPAAVKAKRRRKR